VGWHPKTEPAQRVEQDVREGNALLVARELGAEQNALGIRVRKGARQQHVQQSARRLFAARGASGTTAHTAALAKVVD